MIIGYCGDCDTQVPRESMIPVGKKLDRVVCASCAKNYHGYKIFGLRHEFTVCDVEVGTFYATNEQRLVVKAHARLAQRQKYKLYY